MTKIDIFSGFLGAGKTTLIGKLLKEALAGTKVVLIENEFGEIGIDGGFLQESGIEIKEMNSGCICCSLVGDFGASLKEVLDTYEPERILIEPSGVGKLSDVMKAVQGAMTDRDVQLNSAVAVVDACKCKMYVKNFGEFFINQIEHAGTIVLSRTDRISEEKLASCVALIRQHNAKATIVTTPWDALDGKDILETIEGAGDLEAELMREVMSMATITNIMSTIIMATITNSMSMITSIMGTITIMITSMATITNIIMSTITNIIMITSMATIMSIITTMTTIITMRMRYLQAGVLRRLRFMAGKRLRIFWRSLRKRRNMGRCFAQRGWWPVRTAAGFISTMCPRRAISETASPA